MELGKRFSYKRTDKGWWEYIVYCIIFEHYATGNNGKYIPMQ